MDRDVFGALAMVGLIIHELRFSEPILDLRILKISALRRRGVSRSWRMSFVLFGTGLLNADLPSGTDGLYGLESRARDGAARDGLDVLDVIVGQIARAGYDNQRLIGLSFVLMTIGAVVDGALESRGQPLAGDLAGPYPGLGSACAFRFSRRPRCPALPRERMGYAASLYNMMRNTGAAVGIAYLTNMLVSHQQIHQSYLVEHFSVFDAWRMSKRAPIVPGAPTFQLSAAD